MIDPAIAFGSACEETVPQKGSEAKRNDQTNETPTPVTKSKTMPEVAERRRKGKNEE